MHACILYSIYLYILYTAGIYTVLYNDKSYINAASDLLYKSVLYIYSVSNNCNNQSVYTYVYYILINNILI